MAPGIVLALLSLAAVTRGAEPVPCSSCPNASFGPAPRAVLTHATYAQSIVIADFDRDGNPDVAAGRSQGVSVLMGAGGGRFGPPQETALNTIPSLFPGDFNEDGFPDLVTNQFVFNQPQPEGIAILIGGGTGRFSVGPTVMGNGNYGPLGVGDFDRDGHLDVVLGKGYLNTSIVLLRGDGQAHLAFAGDFETGLGYPNSPSKSAVGDFNGDGYSDIAVSGSYFDFSVLLGGPAGFAPGIPVTGSENFNDLLVADVNGDGKQDILAAAYFGEVFLYPGDGTGHFASPIEVTMGGDPFALAIADVNGDGKRDLAAVDYQYGELRIRLGDGAGGFGLPRTYGMNGPNSLAIADLDGDGLPDFAISNGRDVMVALGDGAGGIQSKAFATGTTPEAVVVADFDGDGHADVATGNYSYTGGVTVRLGDGGAGFAPATQYAQPQDLSNLVALNLNGDNKPDLVGTGVSAGTFILLNDGTGHFGPSSTVNTSCPYFAIPAVGDLNSDGKPDLVVACNNASFSILLGNGSGGFAAPIVIAAPPARWFALGDVNGDGKLDIVSAHFNQFQIATLLGDGTGHFAAPIFSTPSYGGASGVVLADFDGDGKLDVATGGFLQGNNLVVLSGDKTGSFGSPRSYPMEGTTVHLAADFNGDGRPDLVARLTDSIEILMNDGQGNFLPSRRYLSGNSTSSVAAGDFNGDSKRDLVSSNRSENSFTLLLNTNCQARHLVLASRFPGCSAAGSPIAPAPVIRVVDDGENLAACATGTVTADLLAGAVGAVLSGTTTMAIDAGIATFSDLEISAPGVSRLRFTSSGDAPSVRGTFHVGSPTTVSIVGASSVCGDTPTSYDAGPGYSWYLWTLDGVPISFEQTATLGFLTAGSHTLAVRVSSGNCEALASMAVANLPPQVTSVSPSSGTTNGATALSVAGSCFAPGASLTLGGAAATSENVLSPASLTATSPAHLPGPVTAVVTNPDGQTADLSSAYTYVCDPLPPAPVASNNGPICPGQTLQLTASIVPGATYSWVGPNGFASPLRRPTIPNMTADAAGTYSVTATLIGCVSPASTTTVTVIPTASAAIAAPAAVCANRAGNRASVAAAGPGATYVWSIGNGVVTSGGGTDTIVFTSGASGSVTLGVSVTNTCGSSASAESVFGIVACSAEPESLAVDPSPVGAVSDGNGILEPGETVTIRPFWKNPGGAPLPLSGTASGFTGIPGAVYTINDSAADFGTIAAGETSDCGTATGNCYELTVSNPATRPATHWDAVLTETLSDGDAPTTWPIHIGGSFTDVPRSHTFYPFVERILHNGITTGCTATTYCPNDDVFRLQMAVFIARAQAGGDANIPVSGSAQGNPYNCVSGGQSQFTDIDPSDPFCRHVHYLFATGVTTGCVTTPPRQYCSADNVSRGQMALFIARAAAGSDAAVPLTYGPDPVTGKSYSCDAGAPDLHFTDIGTGDIYCRHTHYLWAKDVISGFPDGSFGPTLPVTRGAMAKFLSNGFGLTLFR